MKTELKILVNSLHDIEKLLINQGAIMSSESNTEHTYFQQPEGKVLKLVSEQGKQTQLHKLEKQKNSFIFQSKLRVLNTDKKLQELNEQFGVSKKLDMHAKKYELNDYVFGLYTISNLGTFVIIEGNNPSIEVAKKTLNIDDPRVVTVSFDKL